MVRSEYGIVDMPSIVHDTDQPTVGSAVKVSAITPAGGGLPPIYKTIFVEPSFVSRFSNTAFNVSDASPLILVDTEFSSSGALSTSYSAGSFTVVPGRSYQLSFSVNYTDNGTVVAYRRLTWLDYTASNITAYIQQNAYPQARVIVAGFAGAHGSFNSSNTQCYTATSGVTKLALRAWSDTAAGWTGMGIDRGSTITINEL